MISGKTVLGFLVIVCGLYATDAEPALNRVRRLINGQEEPNGQPWMAVLAYKNTQPLDERPYLVVCGSVLIDQSHVLITAHCFDENIVPRREGATLFIVLGLKDNSWGATDDVQEFALDDVQASVTVNPDYVVQDVFENDIAVITLAQPCLLNNVVQTIPLPPRALKEKRLKNCRFYGWGVTGEPVTDEVFTRFLKSAQLSIVSARVCQRSFFGFLSDDHICAEGTAYPCFGDSGSPLICEFKTQNYIIGLNSFRRSGPCDTEGRPQVYTRISTFLGFIESNISK